MASHDLPPSGNMAAMLPLFRTTEDYLTHYFDIARYQWIFAISIGVFTWLFLVLFQPFGVNNFDPDFNVSLEFLLITAAFGLLVAASVAVNEFLLRPLLVKKLTRRRLTGWLVWTWLLLSSVVYLFYNYLGDWHDFHWPSYLGFIRDIGMLLSIPMAGFIFYVRHESLKSEYVQLQSIRMQTPASRLVHLSSDTQKDQVSVALDDLVLLESQDNYVAVVYMDGETRRVSLVRSSLKRLEESLDIPSLVRCHRSFMVNLARVQACRGNRHGLKLTVAGAGRSIPVSRAYTGTILQKLGTSSGDD